MGIRIRYSLAVCLVLGLLIQTCAPAKAQRTELNIIITSFLRSPTEQIHLLSRLEARGVNLFNLYKRKDVIKAIKQKTTLEDKVAVLIDYMSKGVYLSKHLCGHAMDISKRGDAKVFIQFMRNTENVIVLDEGDHYHLEIIKDCK